METIYWNFRRQIEDFPIYWHSPNQERPAAESRPDRHRRRVPRIDYDRRLHPGRSRFAPDPEVTMNFGIRLAPVVCPKCGAFVGMGGIIEPGPEMHAKACPKCKVMIVLRRDPATGKMVAEVAKPA